MKKRHLIIFIYLLAPCLLACQQKNKEDYTLLEGEALGTYYQILYKSNENFSKEIELFFQDFNNAVNTYIPQSEISQFNQIGYWEFKSPLFPEMLFLSQKFVVNTDSLFDPTMMPLINAWGFGFSNRESLNEEKIDSIKSLIGFENLEFTDAFIKANKDGVMLDFSAMGEGFAIEKISEILISHGVEDFKVEIGGEMKCKGFNPDGKLWRIGIENPNSTVNSLVAIVQLNDESLSTSGSYRKFFIDENGLKKPHIIDPRSGYPVDHQLLSASIKTKNAIRADVMATTCMIMGKDRAIELILNNSELEGFLVFIEDGETRTWKSPLFQIE
ncbi:FAD:protein FMN transferase [Belliella sp. DSM 111904]|uniref:FAD:protein FMN transferase n=1 Tax=Belliella filtrata TaxID=2923435 RepID=A0ABS9V0U3_9BACT|nr:FAD:protein FMN transferase [Belliella filtrata]MCH7410016.1 FAD:protein FMN transferase [Belliella filtrata]